MTGTFINVAAILIGGSLGLIFGRRLPERIHQTVVAGLGLFVLAYGLYNFLKTQNPLIVLGGLLIGALLGEWMKIEDGLKFIGERLEARFAGKEKGSGRFLRGFLTASLVFCIGPIAILGAIQDGLNGNYSLLVIKSVLDGFASLAFASTLGVGVMFSALMILLYQGGISLLAAQLNSVVTPAMMAEMTAVGGVMLAGIAISSLLELKPIRVASFLPALIIAPLIVAILAWMGIK
jgi:uncharacterized membrane protein YqgA involved in biofilm formation